MRASAINLVLVAAVACGGKSSAPALGGESVGQLDTPAQPGSQLAPADPPPVTTGMVTETTVRGLRVIVKRIPGSAATATTLGIAGGVRNWTADDAGVERLALAVATSGGTEQLAKEAWVNAQADLGSSIYATGDENFASIDAWGLTPAWDETFALLVDAFRHPALPATEIEVQREAMLSALAAEQDDPDSKLSRLVVDTIYKGQPYANRATGTIASVKSLTAAQLRAHLEMLRESSRLVLVVVGDVEPQHVIDAAKAALGDLPRGSYRATALPPFKADQAVITTIEQKLPTNYIEAVTLAPAWNDPNFWALRVAFTALHTRMFNEVRTKRNLSYAPSAFMQTRGGVPMLGLYVTAVDPKTTMGVMLDEAKRLREEPLPAGELAAAKAQFTTRNYTRAEGVAAQADRIVTALFLAGDWRALEAVQGQVAAVTAAQIQAWTKAHLTHLQVFEIGDPSKLDRAAIEAF